METKIIKTEDREPRPGGFPDRRSQQPAEDSKPETEKAENKKKEAK